MSFSNPPNASVSLVLLPSPRPQDDSPVAPPAAVLPRRGRPSGAGMLARPRTPAMAASRSAGVAGVGGRGTEYATWIWAETAQ